ncbi:MAG: anti-sigma factor family protein [Planctomycetota bacterium]|jgi:hypothetical protein
MKAHLTEQQLIEYQFKLVSDIQVGEISGHLKDCVQCRERLERLQRKFSSLELLRDEITASEELISRVVEQAGKPVKTRFIRFRKPAWLGAVAAVLLVGFILLANHLTEDGTTEPEFSKKPGEITTHQPTKGLDITASSEKKYKLAQWEKNEKTIKGLGDFAEGRTVIDDISERPPFAPASAIELVVLPRREKVQLTIYNSADLTLSIRPRLIWSRWQRLIRLIYSSWCSQRGCGNWAVG